MFDEDELVERFKQTPHFKDAMKRLTPEEASEVETRVEATYRTMIRSLSPFFMRCSTDPKFLQGMQKELDRRSGVVTQEMGSPSVITSEKDGKKKDA